LAYFVSCADGSLGKFLLNSKRIDIKLVKPKINELNSSKTQIMLKPLSFHEDIGLFLGENRALYVIFEDDVRKIEGVYDGGRLLSNNILLAIRKGAYDMFIISKDDSKDTFKMTKMNTFDVHFKDITYLCAKGLFFYGNLNFLIN
jgi:hypothetical protein